MLVPACRTPAPANPPGEAAECPEPPTGLSPIEEVRQLSQEAREARANLMVPLDAGDEGLFATLHPLELSLIEAVLVEPSRARQLDRAWLRKHLLRATLEIHSSRPIPAFDGDLREAVLVDERGQRLAALGLGVRSDSQGWTYRFLLDPRWLHTDKDARLRFQVPTGERVLEASWALSRTTLDRLEDQPIVFHLNRLRELSWARWQALAGDRTSARASVEELLACAPDLVEAQTLKRALATPPPLLVPEQPSTAAPEEHDLPAGPRHLVGDPGQDAVRELALRERLLGRLGGAFASGLLRFEGLGELTQVLLRGSRAPRAADEEVAAALLAFDRRLAELLAEGLDVESPAFPARPVRPMRFRGGLAFTAAEVDAELVRRLALASHGLLPQHVPAPRRGARDRQLFEMRPLLEADAAGERVLAKPHLRLGRGWLHPGLPALHFKVSLRDHGAEYWSGEAARAGDLPAVRAVASRLLEQELDGPDDAAAALAMAGLVELDAGRARRRLLPLLDAARAASALDGTRASSALDAGRAASALDAARAASALRALSGAGGREVLAALLQAVRSPRPELRAAALEGLARQDRAEDRALLRATVLVQLRGGLRDPDARVATAAMLGLLRLRDAEALKLARDWLGVESARRQALLQAAAEPAGLPALGKELLGLLRGAATSESAVVAAVARSSEARAAAAAFLRLYVEVPGLRRPILEGASGPAYQPLLLRAAGETDLALRRLALARLAELQPPPRAPFAAALESKLPELRLVGNLGLARLGDAPSLLALAEAARGSCEDRALVLSLVSAALDAAGRRRLLQEALRCPGLEGPAWTLIVQRHPEDLALLRLGLSHPERQLRVRAALLALGLRKGAVLGTFNLKD